VGGTQLSDDICITCGVCWDDAHQEYGWLAQRNGVAAVEPTSCHFCLLPQLTATFPPATPPTLPPLLPLLNNARSYISQQRAVICAILTLRHASLTRNMLYFCVILMPLPLFCTPPCCLLPRAAPACSLCLTPSLLPPMPLFLFSYSLCSSLYGLVGRMLQLCWHTRRAAPVYCMPAYKSTITSHYCCFTTLPCTRAFCTCDTCLRYLHTTTFIYHAEALCLPCSLPTCLYACPAPRVRRARLALPRGTPPAPPPPRAHIHFHTRTTPFRYRAHPYRRCA